MRKSLIIVLIAVACVLTGFAKVQETEAQPEAAALPSTPASPVADGGVNEDLPYVEPETVAEPTLRLDEPSTATSSSKQTTVNVTLAMLTLCSLILAAWSLMEVRRLKRRLDEAATTHADEPADVNKPAFDEPKVISTQPVRRTRPAPTPKPTPAPAETPRHETAAQPVTLYLSRPDEDDCFARATTAFEPGNSIFLLTSNDGINGSFSVINDPDVHRLALMMPTQNLTRACSGNAIQLSAGKSRIVTDRAGKAIRDNNGRWHITLKAIIHYE